MSLKLVLGCSDFEIWTVGEKGQIILTKWLLFVTKQFDGYVNEIR